MTPTPSRQRREDELPPMAESQLQDAVVELATALGYLVAHARDSRMQALEGFPDLVLAPRVGSGLPVLFVELKTEKGQLTTGRLLSTWDGRGRWVVGQDEWRDRLLAAGAKWILLRPSDWLNGTIERALKGEK